MKNTILVATDFSPGARNAAKYAKMIAKATGQKLTYIHIHNLPIVDPLISTGAVAESIDDLKNESENRLKMILAQDELEGVKSDFKTSFNDIISLIEEIDKTEGVSLVVIGRTGHRTFFDKILGSTAQGLISQIPQPLLVVPDNYEGDIFEKMAYASKFKFDELEYLGKTLEWKKLSKNDLEIVHVLEKIPLENSISLELTESIDAKFGKEGYYFKVFDADFYTSGISNYTESEGVSLLFVTTRKRKFIEGIFDPSKTKAMIHKIDIPVVVYNYLA